MVLPDNLDHQISSRRINIHMRERNGEHNEISFTKYALCSGIQ